MFLIIPKAGTQSKSFGINEQKQESEVMIYMTMIASIYFLIYKKVNDLGYKTKRRIAMEIRDMITAIQSFLPEKSRQKNLT